MAKWDMIELATKHGPLLERLLAKSSGAIGEILVEDELLSLRDGTYLKPQAGTRDVTGEERNSASVMPQL